MNSTISQTAAPVYYVNLSRFVDREAVCTFRNGAVREVYVGSKSFRGRPQTGGPQVLPSLYYHLTTSDDYSMGPYTENGLIFWNPKTFAFEESDWDVVQISLIDSEYNRQAIESQTELLQSQLAEINAMTAEKAS